MASGFWEQVVAGGDVPTDRPLDELTAELEAAGLEDQKKHPLFRTVNKARQLTASAMSRHDVFRMIRRRAKAAG